MKKYNDPISKSLYALTKKYEMNTMSDMYAMYIDIQNRYELLKQQYPNVHIKEFDLPTDDGNYFHFEFPEKNNNIQMWNHVTKTGEDILITKNYKTTKELQDAMEIRTEDMKTHAVHLGEPPTLEFMNSLNNANIGDIYTYNTGFTFSIKSRDGLQLELLTAYQDVNDISMQNFSSQETYTVVAGNPIDMRRLYRMARDLRTETCELRMSNHESTKVQLQKEVLNQKAYGTKKFYVGNEWFVGQKTPMGIKWFDKNGNKINEDTIVRFYAWAKTSPAHISVHTTKDDITLLDKYEQYAKLEQLQELFSKGNNENLSTEITHLLDDNTGMTFSISSLTKQSSDYVKTKFSFIVKDGQLNIFKMNEDKIEQTSINDFIAFYKEKYQEHYQVLHKTAFGAIKPEVTKESSFENTKQKVSDLANELAKGFQIHLQPVDEEGINELAHAFVKENNIEKERDEDYGR